MHTHLSLCCEELGSQEAPNPMERLKLLCHTQLRDLLANGALLFPNPGGKGKAGISVQSRHRREVSAPS